MHHSTNQQTVLTSQGIFDAIVSSSCPSLCSDTIIHRCSSDRCSWGVNAVDGMSCVDERARSVVAALCCRPSWTRATLHERQRWWPSIEDIRVNLLHCLQGCYTKCKCPYVSVKVSTNHQHMHTQHTHMHHLWWSFVILLWTHHVRHDWMKSSNSHICSVVDVVLSIVK